MHSAATADTSAQTQQGQCALLCWPTFSSNHTPSQGPQATGQAPPQRACCPPPVNWSTPHPPSNCTQSPSAASCHILLARPGAAPPCCAAAAGRGGRCCYQQRCAANPTGSALPLLLPAAGCAAQPVCTPNTPAATPAGWLRPARLLWRLLQPQLPHTAASSRAGTLLPAAGCTGGTQLRLLLPANAQQPLPVDTSAGSCCPRQAPAAAAATGGRRQQLLWCLLHSWKQRRRPCMG
jgi:hypothetical protein